MVSGFTDLLFERLGDDLDDESREYLHFAHDGAQRMQLLIRDLLVLSRLTQPDEQLMTEVDLNQVMNDVTTDLQPRIAEADATVVWDSLPRITANEAQMRQLFANLVGNALKFRSDEPPRVEISASKSAVGWEFAVTDNGIGIPPEQRERVFKLFQRLNARDEYEGTGMGLAISEQVVHLHNGTIQVRSAPSGVGSQFVFSVPTQPLGAEDEQ